MYYSTLNKSEKNQANLKPGTIWGNTSDDGSDLVSKTPAEDIVTPNTKLKRTIESINTGSTEIEYDGIVPDTLVNMTKDEVVAFYKNVDGDMKVTEFSKDQIVVAKYTPYLPDHYVVKIEGNDIVVYRTDDDGIAYRYEEFTPMPCKNKDDKIIKGIEVENEEDIYNVIGDYD